MTSRELAINILYKIENAESYSNIEIIVVDDAGKDDTEESNGGSF